MLCLFAYDRWLFLIHQICNAPAHRLLSFFELFWEHYLPNRMTSCAWMTFILLQDEIALVWILAGEEETSPFHGLMKREVEEESSLFEGVMKREEEVVVVVVILRVISSRGRWRRITSGWTVAYQFFIVVLIRRWLVIKLNEAFVTGPMSPFVPNKTGSVFHYGTIDVYLVIPPITYGINGNPGVLWWNCMAMNAPVWARP